MIISLEEVRKLLSNCAAINIDGVATSKYKLEAPGTEGEVFFSIEWCCQQQKHFEVKFKRETNISARMEGSTLFLRDVDNDEWALWLLFPGTEDKLKEILRNTVAG